MLSRFFTRSTFSPTHLLRQILSAHCLLCDTGIQSSHLSLCSECQSELPYILHNCQQCGRIMPINTPTVCGHCQKNPPYTDHTFSLFEYKTPINYFIRQIKFHHSLITADLLGKLMAEALAEHIKQYPNSLPEAMIPIPLHNKRLRERGYNQALEIARPIAVQLKIPLLSSALIRNKATRAQTDCSLKERQKNMANSFELQHPIPYKNVALIDDVITTGTTINEAARILKRSGIEQVHAWSCANTQKKR